MRTELIFWKKKQMEIVSHNREQNLKKQKPCAKRYETGMANPQMSDPWTQYAKNEILEWKINLKSKDQRNDRRKLLCYKKQQDFSNVGEQSRSKAN